MSRFHLHHPTRRRGAPVHWGWQRAPRRHREEPWMARVSGLGRPDRPPSRPPSGPAWSPVLPACLVRLALLLPWPCDGTGWRVRGYRYCAHARGCASGVGVRTRLPSTGERSRRHNPSTRIGVRQVGGGSSRQGERVCAYAVAARTHAHAHGQPFGYKAVRGCTRILIARKRGVGAAFRDGPTALTGASRQGGCCCCCCWGLLLLLRGIHSLYDISQLSGKRRRRHHRPSERSDDREICVYGTSRKASLWCF